MFCPNCGNQIPDGSAFCPVCNAQLSPVVTPQKPKTDLKKILIPIVCVVALVAVVAGIVFAVNGGKSKGGSSSSSGGGSSSSSSYTKVIDNYFKAIEKNNADLMQSSVVSQYQVEYINSNGEDASEIFEEIVQYAYEDYYYDCGENFKIEYEIVDKEQATEEDLAYLKENFYDYYDISYDEDQLPITDGYEIEVECTITGDDYSTTDSYNLDLIKEDGKWRILYDGYLFSF